MTNYYSTTLDSKNIQFIQRGVIAKALKDGDSITSIAKELGFSRQAIHNEIKRGTIEQRKSDLTTYTIYDPYAAQYAQVVVDIYDCIIAKQLFSLMY